MDGIIIVNKPKGITCKGLYLMINGVINVYKEVGFTSRDAVSKLTGILRQRKIGHTGTLDPLASGVMLICVGKSTKLAQDLEAKDKVYIADFDIGYATDTYDIEGKKIVENHIEVSKENLIEATKKFLGSIKQVPPMYSAIKMDGKKLYDLARKGIEVERSERDVKIEYINILNFGENKAQIQTKVSKGCYIRSLIYDIGKDLGTYATMTELLRTAVGDYSLEQAYTLEEIENLITKNNFEFLKTVEEIFNYPIYKLNSEKEFTLFRNGNTVKINEKIENGRYRIYFQNEFVGLANVEKNILIKGYKYY